MVPEPEKLSPNAAPDHHATAETGGIATWTIALLCLAVIAVGCIVYLVLVISAPEARKRTPEKLVPLVKVQKIFPETQRVSIQAMGTVVPAKELILKSRVAGEIIHIHPEFTQGGIIRKGEQILRIDDLDYRLIVSQKQSAVANAAYELKLELGRQDVAQREWELLYGDDPSQETDAELALRKPQLEKAQSDLKAAKAELEAARLQLSRTKITAPFNCIIRTTEVEKGSQVAAQEDLATLVGTDEYWVQASIPVDRLKWIEIPKDRRHQGAEAKIIYQGDAVRTGRAVKLLSDLETEGRMARLVVSITDPLGLDAPDDEKPAMLPAMLIGEYVRLEIQGSRIEDAFRIPRSALRDNTHIWLADAQGKLEIKEIRTLWRDNQSVLIKDGLEPGARLIVSDLAAPVSGMAVDVDNGDKQPTASAAKDTPK
jgi:RND family efflux transporter MFP subunit